MFYVMVVVMALVTGAVTVVAALVNPVILAVYLGLLFGVPILYGLVRNVLDGELFNPLVATIAAVILVPLLLAPMHPILVGVTALWAVAVLSAAVVGLVRLAKRLRARPAPHPT